MWQWLHDQIYHFNVLNVLCVLAIVHGSALLSKANTYREIENLSAETKKSADDIKDCIRDNTNRIIRND